MTGTVFVVIQAVVRHPARTVVKIRQMNNFQAMMEYRLIEQAVAHGYAPLEVLRLPHFL